MKTMKTLTVNGVTYTVMDPNAAVIDDAGVGEGAWSGKHIADLFCPAFSEAGKMVTCEPLAGYPLKVAGDGAITRCGKNLFDDVQFYKDNGFVQQEDGTWYGPHIGKKIFTNPEGVPGSFAVSCYSRRANQKENSFVFQFKYTDGSLEYLTGATNEQLGYISGKSNAEKVLQNIQTTYQNGGNHYVKDIQIEYGGAATAYEPCVKEEFAAGAMIPALKGLNTLWGQGEEITVEGRLDPVTAFEKLAAKVGV